MLRKRPLFLHKWRGFIPEFFGKGIHKGGNYLPDSVNFILFDIKIGEWCLTRDSIEEIAEMLSVKIVPIIGIASLDQAV